MAIHPKGSLIHERTPMRSNRRTIVLVLSLVPVVPALPRKAGESRPFKGPVTAVRDNIFNGQFAPPATFEGGGPVTHMENTTQSGTLFLLPPTRTSSRPVLAR